MVGGGRRAKTAARIQDWQRAHIRRSARQPATVSVLRRGEAGRSERQYVAATKASPATKKPVKRTATKTHAKRTSANDANGSAPVKRATNTTRAANTASAAKSASAAHRAKAAKPTQPAAAGS